MKKLMIKKVKFKDLMYYYLLFLFVLPDDFYRLTAIKNFYPPENIIYKIFFFHFSYLFTPIILYGVYLYWKENEYMQSNIFIFLMCIFIKDLILTLLGNSYLFINMSWELYGQMLVSISSVCIIFSKNKSSDELLKFWETFSIITIITLIISIITGIGTTAWTGNRYHASNLTYGETGLLIGLFITYLLCVKDNQYKFIYSGISLVLLIATGSRKDIIYVLIVYVIYILNNVTSIKNLKIKTTFKSLAIHFFMVLLVGGMIIIRGNDLLEKLEVERTMNAINGLLTEGIHYIIEDSSGEGRIESIKSGIDVIKDNPLGVTFSFYNSQENMQLKQYPTFAHVSVIFYYIILGPLGIYIFYQYIKNYYHLNKIHNNFKYIYLYFIIYNCISGGALLNFKILISNIFILWIGNKLIIESKIKLNK